MNLFFLITKIRYLRPIYEFWDMKILLIPISVISGMLCNFLSLFKTDVELFLMLTLFILLDFLTGIIASRRNELRITSLGGRQTIVKFIEYFVFLGMLILLSNKASEYNTNEYNKIIQYLSFIFKDIDIMAFFMLAWLEVISVTENLLDKKGAIKEVIQNIKNSFNKNTHKTK